MNDQHLHIIAFNVPWPANYGGVIDVFYRARALSEAGVKVHLHCFEYGRGKQEVLDFCHELHYYKRDTSPLRQLGRRPYIVASRRSKELVNRLLQDDYPILCEGIHTAALLEEESLKGRRIFVRMHNIEQDYYRQLGRAEKKWWKRCYYFAEARKLERYEPILERASGILAITEKDAAALSARYANVTLLSPSCATDKVTAQTGRGEFVLYHGNLSVRENDEAANWLLDNVFSKLSIPCVIAGLNPSQQLCDRIDKMPFVTLHANLTEEKMREMIRNAQVNVLVTHQPTGLKLKLLNSLYQGRHCVVNNDMVRGTDLGALCTLADNGPEMMTAIAKLWDKPFTEKDVQRRQEALSALYDNRANAMKVLDLL
ncbi:MAG: glycosyltransferase family 1 protein [Bacteroidales bacterium]|nr:glycosyltransferase family 1 protein [Bacteroidales bacterium]